MANAAIAYNNLFDDATLRASTQELFLPANNMQNQHVARKWRGTSSSSDYVAADLGASPGAVDTIGVFGITGDQIRVAASNTDPTGGTGEVFDTGLVSVDDTYASYINLIATASPKTARYWRFELAASGGFLEIGRVFLGTRTVFPYNFGRGWSRGWTDRSVRSKTRGGQTQVFRDVSYRSIDLSFDLLSQSDRDGFIEDIDRLNGMNTDVLFITNPASSNLPRDSIWGLMTQLTPVVQPYPNAYTKQYQLEERL
jgi:hypothetical protein